MSSDISTPLVVSKDSSVDVDVRSVYPSMPWDHHSYLSSLFGDNVLESIPTVGIANGSTGYLDIVKPSDFVGLAHMVKGKDQFQRHFVSIGLQITDTESGVAEHFIYTIFRRYTDSNSCWVMCKSHYSESSSYIVNNLFDYDMILSQGALTLLKRLIDDHYDKAQGIVLDNESYDYVESKKTKKTYIIRFYRPLDRADVE